MVKWSIFLAAFAVTFQAPLPGAGTAGRPAVAAEFAAGATDVPGAQVAQLSQPAGPSTTAPTAGVPARAAPLSGPRGQTLDDLFLAVAARVPQFGGLYVARDKALQVVLTDTSASVVEAARQAVNEVFGPERIREGGFHPVQGRYNFPQLHDMHMRARGVLAVPGVVLLDADERRNRLKVGLSRLDVQPTVEAKLAALGIPLEAVIFEQQAPMRMLWDWGPDPQARTRPVVGGTQITVNGAGLCTLGFVTRRAGVNGFVTCSHCTAVQGAVDGTRFDQPNAATPGSLSNGVGTETVDPPRFTGGDCPSGRRCRMSDSIFAVMPTGVTGHQGQILHPDPNFPSNYSIRGTRAALCGDGVSKMGRTSSLTGGVVDGTCADISPVDGNGNDTGFTLLCQDRVEGLAGHGDSGSPVFQGFSNDFDVRLLGLLWGGNDSHFDYSPIASVQAELGLDSNLTDVDRPPTVAITDPPNNARVPFGGFSAVTFTAAMTDFEGGANCCTVTWESDMDGPMGSGASLSYGFLTPGTRRITATATDAAGNPAHASIHVQTRNSAPQVWIVKPHKDAVLHAGVSYVFQGASFDPEKFSPLSCGKLRWRSSEMDAAFPHIGCAPQVSFATPGPRMISLSGADAQGTLGSTMVSVKVVNAPASGPPAVTILRPINDQFVDLNASPTLALKGIAKDPDGKSPLSYRWLLKGVPESGGDILLAQGSTQNDQPFANTWAPKVAQLPFRCGGYFVTLELDATDADHQIGTDSVTLIIEHPVC
ncbi:MAG: hypothetical protein WCE79_13645 [Xanthobacteraceae bacterium]